MQIIRIFLISAGLTGLAWLVPIAGQSQEFRKISPRDTFDVAVLMSNPAGIAAAVTAARLGMRTALITESGEPLVVDGWQPDPVTPSLRLAAGGFFREFSDSIRARYREKHEEKPVAFRECREGFSFEPSVAEEVLERLLLNQPGLTLFRDFTFDALPENLVENTAGRGRDIRIHRVGKSSRERWIRATVWIDASEYGALASALGCRFRTGRESREETGEIQAPNSAPIPSEDSLTPVIARLTCDSFLQPPAFSLCLTRKTENFSPFREPGSYHRDAYAALARALRTGKINAFVSGPGKAGLLDTTGLPGMKMAARISDALQEIQPEPDAYRMTAPAMGNPNYPGLRLFTEGLLFFARSDTALPEWFRREARSYGYARNEYRQSDHFPAYASPSPTRRTEGRFLFLAPQPVEQGKPTGGIHAGSVATACAPAGPVQTLIPPDPFTIPYGVMLPADIPWLLCPVAVSASFLGMACLQSRHARMQLGQAAGVAAALSVRKGKSPDRLRVAEVQEELLRLKARLVPIPDSLAGVPGNEWMQKAALLGWLVAADARLQEEMTGADWELIAARTGFSVPELKKISPGKNRGEILGAIYQTYHKAWKGKDP